MKTELEHPAGETAHFDEQGTRLLPKHLQILDQPLICPLSPLWQDRFEDECRRWKWRQIGTARHCIDLPGT